MRVLGLIPARGQSKGIPRKNIWPLAGKPLLAYTAEAALLSRRLSRVILSTDDEEIAAVGRNCGLEVPFLRPEELATDGAPTIGVVQHAIRYLQSAGSTFQAVMVLQPTNPLREAADIDGAVDLLRETGADSVIAFVDVGEKHPARMKSIDGEGRVHNLPFNETQEGLARQQLPKLYLREGSIYLTRIPVVMESGSLQGSDCRAWIIEPERACNIDTQLDMEWAEFLIARRRSKQ